MRKNYILLLFMFLGIFAQAQLICPNSIKTTGGSTPSAPQFLVPNSGPGSCSDSWPATITINGTLTYNYVSCMGGKLEYNIDSGTPPPTFEMTVDFGGGTVCPYDANGDLTTLATTAFKEFSVFITPNPSTNFISVSFESQHILTSIKLFTISGQLIYKSKSKTIIDVSKLNSGMYILRVETNKGMAIKKLIKN